MSSRWPYIPLNTSPNKINEEEIALRAGETNTHKSRGAASEGHSPARLLHWEHLGEVCVCVCVWTEGGKQTDGGRCARGAFKNVFTSCKLSCASSSGACGFWLQGMS